MDRRRFLQQTGLRAAGAALAAHLSFAGNAPAAETPAPATGPLRVHPENRRYFADGTGRAVYLTGSHTWSNLVDHGPKRPAAEVRFRRLPRLPGPLRPQLHPALDVGADRPGTTEGVGREPKRHTVQPHPFARTGPGKALDGKPKFDLAKFDPAYFERLRSRVEAAGEAGHLRLGHALRGLGHPVRRRRLEAASLPPGQQCQRHRRRRGPRRRHPHAQRTRRSPPFRRPTLRKVVDTLNDLDNVLYEISNENHPPSTEWQYHIIRFVEGLRADQGEAASGGDDVPVQGREQQDALRQSGRLDLAQSRGRLPRRPAGRRRAEGDPQRHRPSLGPRRQRALGVEELPAGHEPALHGPLRRRRARREVRPEVRAGPQGDGRDAPRGPPVEPGRDDAPQRTGLQPLLPGRARQAGHGVRRVRAPRARK